MAKSKPKAIGVGGLHRRATKWEHGDVPENLLGLCREYRGRVAHVHCLRRAGRTGFKHVGLELEVDRDSPPSDEDFAGAILSMMVDHAKAHDVDHFRVDFFDDNMDKLADLPMKVSPEGDVDEWMEGGSNVATKVLLRLIDKLETHVDHGHTRYCGLLEKIEGLTEQIALSMEALAGAVATASDQQMQNAEASAGRAEAEYKHERDMKLLDLLISRVGSSGASSGANPLRKMHDAMPDDVKDGMKAVVGEDNWSAYLACVAETDRAKQASMLAAILGRLSSEQKAALGRAVPGEWQAKMQAAFEATLAGGLGG